MTAPDKIAGAAAVIVLAVAGYVVGQFTGGDSAIHGAILGALLVLVFKHAR